MTEAGWTRNKPTVAGWYWWRTNAKDEKPWVVKVQRLDMGMMQMWCIGCDRPVIIGDGGEFLGPLTPDSYRQGRAVACEWTYDDIDDYYETACKNAYCLADGTLKDNEHKYCPYCGRLIQLAQQAQDEKGVGDAEN